MLGCLAHGVASTVFGVVGGEIWSRNGDDKRHIASGLSFAALVKEVPKEALPSLSYLPGIGSAIQGAFQPVKNVSLKERAISAFVGSIAALAATHTAEAIIGSLISTTVAPLFGAAAGIAVGYNIALCMLQPVQD